MHCRGSIRILVAILILIGTINIAYGQSKQASAIENQVLNRELGIGRIREQGISNLFSSIALRFNIPIGVEVAANDDLMAWYQVEFRGETLIDFLVKFSSDHKRYSWQVQDGVINIFPTSDHDPVIAELLETKITGFSITANTDSFAFANSLMSTPEVNAIMTYYRLKPADLNFSGVYFPQLGRNFTKRFDHDAMRSILNTVVRESSIARAWTIKRLSDQRLFIRVDANAEPDERSSKAP